MALLRPYFLGKVALGVPLDCHERLLVAGGWRGGFWGDDAKMVWSFMAGLTMFKLAWYHPSAAKAAPGKYQKHTKTTRISAINHRT